LVRRLEAGYRLRDTKLTRTYVAEDLDEVHEIVGQIAELEGGTAHGDWGAGDVVQLFTNAVGIEPCDSCRKRKAWLNSLFPRVMSGKAR